MHHWSCDALQDKEYICLSLLFFQFFLDDKVSEQKGSVVSFKVIEADNHV
ncbi:hypothetical protein H710_00606 [Bartonella bacilliformis Ver097]|uniref:Uncharacterized protein n=1 Tax=Bartonella bacilliformis Ver097 TaxID=1293911 RepID=A0A072R2K4_BARBA|nr:hypothetical protein H710_00606 [Bartonella bacilliformis Ver097]